MADGFRRDDRPPADSHELQPLQLPTTAGQSVPSPFYPPDYQKPKTLQLSWGIFPGRHVDTRRNLRDKLADRGMGPRELRLSVVGGAERA